jgi:hypothetical protein
LSNQLLVLPSAVGVTHAILRGDVQMRSACRKWPHRKMMACVRGVPAGVSAGPCWTNVSIGMIEGAEQPGPKCQPTGGGRLNAFGLRGLPRSPLRAATAEKWCGREDLNLHPVARTSS